MIIITINIIITDLGNDYSTIFGFVINLMLTYLLLFFGFVFFVSSFNKHDNMEIHINLESNIKNSHPVHYHD